MLGYQLPAGLVHLGCRRMCLACSRCCTLLLSTLSPVSHQLLFHSTFEEAGEPWQARHGRSLTYSHGKALENVFVAAEPCRPQVWWLCGTELIWCHSNVSSRVEKEGPSLDLSLCWSLRGVFCWLLGTPGSLLPLPSAPLPAKCWLVPLHAGLVRGKSQPGTSWTGCWVLQLCSPSVHGFFEQKAPLPGLEEMGCN